MGVGGKVGIYLAKGFVIFFFFVKNSSTSVQAK